MTRCARSSSWATRCMWAPASPTAPSVSASPSPQVTARSGSLNSLSLVIPKHRKASSLAVRSTVGTRFIQGILCISVTVASGAPFFPGNGMLST